MRFSFYTILKVCLTIALGFAFYSYMQLAKQEGELSDQISGLKKQIEALQAEAHDDPGNQSKEHKETDQSLAALLIEKNVLAVERELQEESYLELQEEFLKYQKDYPIIKRKADWYTEKDPYLISKKSMWEYDANFFNKLWSHWAH